MTDYDIDTIHDEDHFGNIQAEFDPSYQDCIDEYTGCPWWREWQETWN